MSFRMVKPDKEYSEEEIMHMVINLRGGDREMIIPLIKAHITLANKIAGFFTRHNVNRREDLYAVAFHGLVDCVNHLAEKLQDNNATPFIARSIKGAIQMFLVSDCLIPIPRGEFKKRMEKEDAISFILRTSTSSGGGLEILDREVHEAGVIENIAVILPLSNKVMENIDIPVLDYSFQKMEDLYSKMGLTEEEIQIVDMRLDGLTMEEVAEKLGISKPGVYYKIQEVKTKISRLGLKMPNHSPVLSGTKVCSRCKIEQSLSFFYKIGEGCYKSICKGCMKEVRDVKTANIS